VPAILADNDVEGQLKVLLSILRGETWRELWDELNCTVHGFESLGLLRTISDSQLWHLCQQQQIVLVTGNRNKTDSNSLEATILAHNKPESLPVFTLAVPKRIKTKRSYAERVAAKLLERLFDLEELRGTGRIYLP
jgi:hypothetical protein